MEKIFTRIYNKKQIRLSTNYSKKGNEYGKRRSKGS